MFRSLTVTVRYMFVTKKQIYLQFHHTDEAGLRVGWESIKYTVSEREERVEICLTTSSPVPDTLSFLVYTEGQTAEGKSTYL